jgi:prophage antirepressor-like protein
MTLFNYNEIKIRTVIIDCEIWFVASDVCKVIEISNPRDATSSLLAVMKKKLTRAEINSVGLTDIDPRTPNLTLISEAGLYKLVFRSRKPEAEKFSDWVAGEVLPTIRKTGSYGTTQKILSPMLARFELNAKKNSVLGYWSMLNKMTELFALPLELAGLILPENVVPDISTGKLFCEYLRQNSIDPEY